MIKKLYKKYEEVILYVVFGGLTTLVNFVSFWVFNKILGEKFYLVSNVIAWFISVVFAYVTNKLWVFESKSWAFKILLKEVPEFFAARLFSLGVEEGGLWLFVDIFGFDRYSFTVFNFEVTGKLIAKVLLAVIVVILNYFFSKFIIFATKGKKKDKKEIENRFVFVRRGEHCSPAFYIWSLYVSAVIIPSLTCNLQILAFRLSPESPSSSISLA